MTALTNDTPFIELLLKITRSSTAFLNDAPSKLALTAAACRATRARATGQGLAGTGAAKAAALHGKPAAEGVRMNRAPA